MLFGNKPKRVDKTGLLKEIWDELHDKKIAVIIVLLVDAVLSIVASGVLFVTFEQLGHSVLPKYFKKYNLDVSTVLSSGILRSWFISIPLFVLLVYLSFLVYRSLRKTYNKNYDDNYLQSEKESFGGAHWQTDKELEEHCNIVDDIVDTTDDILGTDDDGKIYSLKPIPGMPRNRLIVGSIGSGKTSSIIYNSIFQGFRKGISLIVTDTKGDIYRYTSGVARMAHYKVRVLNLKQNELKNSDGFDLFNSLRADDPALDVKADVITNIIFNNTTGVHEIEDYWYKNEYNLIYMAIMVIATSPNYKRDNKNHLPELYNFVSSHNPSSLRTLMENYRTTDPRIYKAYASFANAKEQSQGDILNGAAMRLRKLNNNILQKSLSVNEIDTVAPMNEKCIYYVIIPDMDNTYKFISSLFFTQLFMDEVEYFDSLPKAMQKETLPVAFLLDEYFASGGIAGLANKIATVRSRKIELTIILQNITQLNAMYEDAEVEAIKSNCTIKGLLATNDLSTAEEFSKLIGTETIITESHRYMESAADVVHALPTIQKTMGENTRPLVLPEELLNGKFGRNEVIYVINGMPPIRIKKYFAELGGEPNHFMFKEALELMEKEGERLPSRHKPKWRHDEEERLRNEEAKREAAINATSTQPNNNNDSSANESDNSDPSEITSTATVRDSGIDLNLVVGDYDRI